VAKPKAKPKKKAARKATTTTYTGEVILADVRTDLAHAGRVLAGDDQVFDDWIRAWLAGEGRAREPLAVMPLLARASKAADELGARVGKEDPRYFRALARADLLCVAFAAPAIEPERTYQLRRGKPLGDAFLTLAENIGNLEFCLKKLGLAPD
jgi:hypothetical protein